MATQGTKVTETDLDDFALAKPEPLPEGALCGWYMFRFATGASGHGLHLTGEQWQFAAFGALRGGWIPQGLLTLRMTTPTQQADGCISLAVPAFVAEDSANLVAYFGSGRIAAADAHALAAALQQHPDGRCRMVASFFAAAPDAGVEVSAGV